MRVNGRGRGRGQRLAARTAMAIAILGLWGCGARTALDTDGGPPSGGDARVDRDAAIPDTPNACGGSVTLDARPGDLCGTCGAYRCVGRNAIECPDPGANACGDCGPLPAETCNGYDDNCDGRTDEGCVSRVGTGLAAFVFEIRISESHAALVVQDPMTFQHRAALVSLDDDAGRVIDPGLASVRGISIDGNLIAYLERDADSATESLWMHEIDRDRRTRFEGGDLLVAGPPAVDADRVAFAGLRRADAERLIAIFDRATAEIAEFAAPSASNVDLDDHWLAYDQCPGDCGREVRSSRVMVRNLRDDTEVDVTAGLEGRHVAPTLHGDRVIWRREHLLDWGGVESTELLAYDLTTGERTTVPTDSRRIVASAPRLFGDRVCFSYAPDDGDLRYLVDLTVVDLTTGRTLGPSRQSAVSCDLNSRAVAWVAFAASEARLRYFEAEEL